MVIFDGDLLFFVALEEFMDDFCFTSFFSFRGNLLECISVRGVTGSARHLCVYGSGLVAWLRTGTLILLSQVLKQNPFILIPFHQEL